jgi:hypothetical protein
MTERDPLQQFVALKMLLAEDWACPEIAVEEDGDISLEWYDEPRWIVSLSIGTAVHWASMLGAAKDEPGKRFRGNFPLTGPISPEFRATMDAYHEHRHQTIIRRQEAQ